MTDLKDFHENLERMNNAQSKINIQNNIDNFAIQFAEWYYCANNNEYCMYPNKSIKEHLQIFKEQRK
jgi:hypothetical protein